MKLLQNIFRKRRALFFNAENQKVRIVLCVSSTFASPIEKPATSALRRIRREIIGNTEENAKTVDSLRHCKKTSSASKSAPKTKKRSEIRSAENFQNGGRKGTLDESSLHLRTANFPSLKGAVNSSSRKILREVLSNLYI